MVYIYTGYDIKDEYIKNFTTLNCKLGKLFYFLMPSFE